MNIYKIIKKFIKTSYFFTKFYLSIPKNQALIASLPRSGTHLTKGLLDVCNSMQKGFPGELGVNDTEYSSFVSVYRPFDERSIFIDHDTSQVWHSHLPYFQIIPFRKKFCKTIVLIRDPVEYVKSYMIHSSPGQNLSKYFKKEISYSDFLYLDKKFKWTLLYINFLSSWKREKDNNRSRNSKYPIVIIDLNFLKLNISNYLKFVNHFYKFNFSNEQMEQAVKQLDINRVSKLSSNKTIRISKENIILSKEVKNYIIEKCQKEYLEISQVLDHDLIKTL